MSSSNCWFLTCMQISQEAVKVVWCSHLFKNFPQFVVIHTVKGFGVINKAERKEVNSLSHVWLFATPWTVACQAPLSPVHGIFQARVLKWVAILFSRESSWLRDWTHVSCTTGRFFTVWTTRKFEDERRSGWQRMRWLDSITDSMNINLSQFWEIEYMEACCAAVHEVEKSRTRLSDWTVDENKSEPYIHY